MTLERQQTGEIPILMEEIQIDRWDYIDKKLAEAIKTGDFKHQIKTLGINELDAMIQMYSQTNREKNRPEIQSAIHIMTERLSNLRTAEELSIKKPGEIIHSIKSIVEIEGIGVVPPGIKKLEDLKQSTLFLQEKNPNRKDSYQFVNQQIANERIGLYYQRIMDDKIKELTISEIKILLKDCHVLIPYLKREGLDTKKQSVNAAIKKLTDALLAEDATNNELKEFLQTLKQ